MVDIYIFVSVGIEVTEYPVDYMLIYRDVFIQHLAVGDVWITGLYVSVW